MVKKDGRSILRMVGGYFSNNGIVAAFLVIFLALSFITENFFSWTNFMNIARSSVPAAVIAFGMVFVISTTGIDLSVGYSMLFCSTLLASMIKNGLNIYLAMLLCLCAGMVIGTVNGVLVTKAKITPFIATLATSRILYGVNMVYTHGVPIYGLSYPELQVVDQTRVFSVPVSVIICTIICIICAIVMYKTSFGRHVIAIGSNNSAARLSGINVDLVTTLTYTITGVLSAVAAIIITSKMEAAVPGSYAGHEVDVIAATVLGGTSMTGGKAKMGGAYLGAILMIIVINGLAMLRINTLWQSAVVGLVILAAIGIDTIATYRKKG